VTNCFRQLGVHQHELGFEVTKTGATKLQWARERLRHRFRSTRTPVSLSEATLGVLTRNEGAAVRLGILLTAQPAGLATHDGKPNPPFGWTDLGVFLSCCCSNA